MAQVGIVILYQADSPGFHAFRSNLAGQTLLAYAIIAPFITNNPFKGVSLHEYSSW
jgi:hypothetical protein